MQRAANLAGGDGISLSTIRRMRAFFERHERNYRPDARESDGGPTAGTIAWLLWGGTPGRRWANGVLRREGELEKQDEDRPGNERRGSARNPRGSAATPGGIELSAGTRTALANRAEEHNRTASEGRRVTAGMLAAVYRRGAGAFSTGARRGMTRAQWAMARVNAFLTLVRRGRPENANYTTDNDLLPGAHPRSTRKALDVRVNKVDDRLGIVFGYAIVCQEGGHDYYDTQGDFIPEDSMLRACANFMAGPRTAKAQHAGGRIGQVVFGYPLTRDIADALGVTVQRTGFVVGMKPDCREMLDRFANGEFTGFSIGGRRIADTDMDEDDIEPRMPATQGMPEMAA